MKLLIEGNSDNLEHHLEKWVEVNGKIDQIITKAENNISISSIPIKKYILDRSKYGLYAERERNMQMTTEADALFVFNHYTFSGQHLVDLFRKARKNINFFYVS